MSKKLAIITTHPIQYYSPVFQLLAKELALKVFYTAGDLSQNKYDPGFQQKIEWDIPLLDGYEFEFLENIAKHKGSHHFKGIVNQNAILQIKAYQPDEILIYGWAYQSHLKIIQYFNGKIPVYFRGDSTLLNEKFNFKSILKTIFLKWVYSHIDTAFYVGSANKAYFKKYGLKEHQLILAPHAIDNDRFAKDQKREADIIRNQFNIKAEDMLILFAGKLDLVKNPELLLEAFVELMKDLDVRTCQPDRLGPKSKDIDPELRITVQGSEVMVGDIQTTNDKRQTNKQLTTQIHLLFVGNGVLEKSLKCKVESLKLKDVHFLNFQNQTQMPAVYQACNLFCLPSKSETWGLAVNEAMACGKAILVSDKVGCAEDLVNTQNGAIFESGNIVDLSQKLIALTNDKSTLKKMGENSLMHIQKWNFKQQMNAIVAHVNR